jgi:hypothetical protein
MFSVCVCMCAFLCLCTGRSLATSCSPVQGVLPTVPDQETEETQPYAPKAGASYEVWEQRGRKKKRHHTTYRAQYKLWYGLKAQRGYRNLTFTSIVLDPLLSSRRKENQTKHCHFWTP